MASYKLASYKASDGSARAGIVIDDTVYDLDAEAAAAGAAGFNGSRVRGVLENWPTAGPALRAISDNPDGSVSQPLSETRLLAPVPRPSAIYCAGANYWDHAAEMGNTNIKKDEIEPFFFIKSGSVVIGPGDDIRLSPTYSKKYDYEVEIALFIGKEGRHVSVDDAMDHIAGYTIMNDLSARERGKRDDWPFGMDWVRHKSFECSAPMGPWIVPADDISDVHDLSMKTTVSGDVRQDSSSRQMIFQIPEQIAALSAQMTLYPGDIIATGTCAGVAGASGKFLNPGEHIVMEIEGIGTLENSLVAE